MKSQHYFLAAKIFAVIAAICIAPLLVSGFLSVASDIKEKVEELDPLAICLSFFCLFVFLALCFVFAGDRIWSVECREKDAELEAKLEARLHTLDKQQQDDMIDDDDLDGVIPC